MIISPLLVKLINPLSKQMSNVGDNNIPLYRDRRSVTFDLDQGFMCDARNKVEFLHPVTAPAFFKIVVA